MEEDDDIEAGLEPAKEYSFGPERPSIILTVHSSAISDADDRLYLDLEKLQDELDVPKEQDEQLAEEEFEKDQRYGSRGSHDTDPSERGSAQSELEPDRASRMSSRRSLASKKEKKSQGGAKPSHVLLPEEEPHDNTSMPTAGPPVTDKKKEAQAKRKNAEVVSRAEVMYHKAHPQPGPDSPSRPRYPCTVSTLVMGGRPDRSLSRKDREFMRNVVSNPVAWHENPCAADPMPAHPFRRMTWLANADTPTGPSWAEREEQTKKIWDHDLAVELGYETLLGNLLYIQIPKAKDLNRSWQNFLSEDNMEWGFPYLKGSKERPRPPQPEPYLAHQMKERLWKYPRTRIFQTQDD